MGNTYYIASCIFTSKFPKLSKQVQEYVHIKYGFPIVRCCVPKYKIQFFQDKMPEDYRDEWSELPDCADFQPGDTVYSLCHNCSAIIEETKPGVIVKSIWELILSDEDFIYPDYHRTKITVQDCWRAKERIEEQKTVRTLLQKMNFDIVELEDNYDKTDFCGISTYRPAPKRNIVMAPHRFVENAAGKFGDYTEEEQKTFMEQYCERFETDKVVACCHYCLEGLELGKIDAKHLASLLFEDNGWRG